MANEKVKPIEIIVDDGYQRVPVRNLFGDEVGVFYFNPTDMGIIRRYNGFVQNFDSIADPIERLYNAPEGNGGEDSKKYEEAIEEATQRLYEAVNKLFNSDAAGAFFGKVNPFSIVGDGEFYCTNVLNKVRGLINDQFDVQVAKINKRVNKYTSAVKKK